MSLRGFLNIDKPAGVTSFDVVRAVRRVAGTRKVGHAGTLDPIATGVLPIAIGDATRLVDELVGARKRYHAVLTLGVETDSYDCEGETVATADASGLTRQAVETALEPFRGESMQTPPAYSAVKVDGVPAYRAARSGKPHRLEPRLVTVYALEIVELRSAGGRFEVTVDVECAKGFYVRSLAYDLGRALRVGGHVSALCRTAVGPFTVQEATPLDRAVELLQAGEHEQLLHAPDVALTSWPALILGAATLAAARHGRDVRPEPRALRRAGRAGERARCYGPDGRLVALVEASAVPGTWHPYRVFETETESQQDS